MTATLIDGKSIAAKMMADTRAEAEGLAAAGWQPRLVSVSVGDVAAAELYVRNQQRQAEAAGVAFEARNYPSEISLEQLVGVLQGLNADPRVNGIIMNSTNATRTWIWNWIVEAAMASTFGWKISSERNQTETVSR